jgi:hypothetical protein
VFLALKENNFRPRILYSEILSFKINKAIKIFHSKQKLRQYMTTKPPQQEILQGNFTQKMKVKKTMSGL